VQQQGSGLSATLELIAPCGAYGPDYERLNLRVHYHNSECGVQQAPQRAG
jgi:hypothetical protein